MPNGRVTVAATFWGGRSRTQPDLSSSVGSKGPQRAGFRVATQAPNPSGQVGLKPIAAIGYPPTRKADWNGCCQRPHERQRQVSQQPEQGESDPEDFPLHLPILDRLPVPYPNQSCGFCFSCIAISSHFFNTLTKWGLTSRNASPMPIFGCE